MATAAALVWTNVDAASYERVWRTRLALTIDHADVSQFPVQLRAFTLSITVVDDLAALLVIATAYSRGLDPFALLLAGALFALVAVLIRIGIGPRVICVPVGVAAWLALSMSGVDPIVIGLAIGLVTVAAPAGRGNLERAPELFCRFREQPTPELARSARVGLTSALSPKRAPPATPPPLDELRDRAPVALANAGIRIDARFLAHAFATPIVLGTVR